MRLEGSELTPLAGSRTPISENVCTESGTVESQKTPSDPDLALIEARWPTLPEHIRQAVLALVRSTLDKDQTP